ncbi:L-ascorbate metabolism protein UlaG (beta-lactamase superfamily) [Chitinophaga niastensis]|uniref:L-ascorbate metabolism protein UlaG (Beta-lactamase superfamily) n=1 Tax=Chitinophaga niastensis TaxID=536980 RepID=A0A2P8HDU1_CHINA|nr:MBL fold metallo-hydrolase [Chitinophaga niastensis]PSL44377.1 L-ascorbate metabolism protein UlaG (beta-lactamase superfamily) [Chitinophaga niastensis]
MKINILTVLFVFVAGIVSAQRVKPDVIPTATGSLTIQPIEHASLVLQANEKTIYADPSGSAEKYKGLAAPDIILITDIHGDHFDPVTIAAIKTAKTIIIVPQVVADKLPAAYKANVVVMKNGDQHTESDIAITAIPMYNLPESANAMHTKGRGNGYILTIGKKLIYLSGDTQGIPEMRALKNIDVAFVCMNLPYTMDVAEAADAVLAFKPKIVYPYHYRGKDGLSDVNKFKSLVDAGNKGIEVRLRDWYRN